MAQYPVIGPDGQPVYGPDGRMLLTDNPSGQRSTTNTSGAAGDGTSPPQSYQFTNRIGAMLNQPWKDNAYTLPYGNYGPQFPNLGTHVGSAMYTNIQPRQMTPNWMIDRLPPRLGYQANGQPDPNSPYLTGRKMGNYGALFERFGAAPTNPQQQVPGQPNPYFGGAVPFGGGNYQNTTSPFNPYPLNGYDPSRSLNVQAGPNPFLQNQQGGMAWGAPGGGLSKQLAAAPPPPGPTNNPLGVGGGTPPPPAGGGPPPSGGGGGPQYIDLPEGGGVINLTGGAGPPTWQVPYTGLFPETGTQVTKALQTQMPGGEADRYAALSKILYPNAPPPQSPDIMRKALGAGDVPLPSNGYGYGTPGGYRLDTAPATTDPGSMLGLLGFLGGGNFPSSAAQYANWYAQTYGQQAPGGPKAYP
jgi:hypothetical protein